MSTTITATAPSAITNLISGPVQMEGKLALQLLEAAAATAPQTLASPPPAPSADEQLGTTIDVRV